MLQAAKRNKLSPLQLSFATVVRTLAASWVTLPTQSEAAQLLLIEVQIDSVSKQLNGKCPNRVEPRAVKRRPKKSRMLTTPRKEWRDLLLRGIDLYDNKKTPAAKELSST